MSKLSLRSRAYSRSFTRIKKGKYHATDANIKPFNFCCSLHNFDPLTKYNQRYSPYKSSLTTVHAVDECPVLKFRTQFTDSIDYAQKRDIPTVRNANSKDQNLWKINSSPFPLRGRIEWFVEDEISLAKEVYWKEKQKAYNEQMFKNIAKAKEKAKATAKRTIHFNLPRWYQDFSIDQMKNLMKFECIMRNDYEEGVTYRSENILVAIGIFSNFFKLSSKTIRKLQRTCNLSPIDILREMYKILTGNYFENEGYKKFYNCNERIILSAIAFLTLPEALAELHKRLPPVIIPKIPQKPKPLPCPVREKKRSPYSEKLFIKPDWIFYINRLQEWRKHCKTIAFPKLVLFPEQNNNINYKKTLIDNEEEKHNTSLLIPKKKMEQIHYKTPNINETESQEYDIVETPFNTSQLPDGKRKFDFTITGLSEKPGPIQYKICGTLKPLPKKKSWLGDKDMHYIISGVSDDPPSCPVKYEMTGITNVTPSNSDERFFAVLKLEDGPKKIYPSGRENLSKKWQEWLQNVDEEFKIVEREANKMIKSIEATMRLVLPGPTCDSCCPCRQTRKIHKKWRETKAPYLVVDTIAEDVDKNRYIVGSMAMHSPAPSLPASAVNLLEIISSEDKLVTNLLINGVTNEKGETQYYISGLKKDKIHIPSQVVESLPPKPLMNVPPCACAIQQIFNKHLSPTLSSDNIPWAKTEGLCFGKKYRPKEPPAFSCQMYPGDKSCKRNPFIEEIKKLKKQAERSKMESAKNDQLSKKKQMYSVADFKPCGDKDGMNICGGQWGDLHTSTAEEIAEQERLRKEILKAPPCGIKPGLSVCEEPWGAIVPEKKHPRYVDKEDIGEGKEEVEDEEEEEEEQEKEAEKPVEIIKQKILRRDKQCRVSPESIATRTRVVKKKEGRFIPDPTYSGYDDLWNIFRTAPSEKKTDDETDYEKSLKLTPAKPQIQTTIPLKRYKKTINDNVDINKQQEEAIDKSKKHGYKVDYTNLPEKGNLLKEFNKKIVKKLDKRKHENQAKEVQNSKQCIEENKHFLKSKRLILKNEERVQKIRGTISPQKEREKNKRLSYTAKTFTKIKSDMNRNNKNKKSILQNKLNIISNKLKEERNYVTNKVGKEMTSIGRNNNFDYGNIKQQKDFKIQKRKKIDIANGKANSTTSTITKTMKLDTNKQKNIKKDKKQHLNKTYTKTAKKLELSAIGEIDPVEQKKDEMEKLKNMMKSPTVYPYNVEPVILSEVSVPKCQREFEEDVQNSTESLKTIDSNNAHILKKGPCGWRTKSEQQLPAQKNLTYLTAKHYPMETIPVKEGGKRCVCRENRNKKKILLYNVGGLIGKKKDGTAEHGKLLKKKKEESDDKTQVVDGVIYFTPPPSLQRSDEYIVEYDLYKSPYDMCTSYRKDDILKLFEQHSGPKSLVSKTIKDTSPCNCNNYTDTYGVVDDINDFRTLKEPRKVEQKETITKNSKQEQIKSKLLEEQWTLALKNVGLTDYFTRYRNNVPCWLKCKKFYNNGNSLQRRLVMKAPVCECKYERKILQHKEEQTKWKERQRKLKSFKKNPFINVANTSRPIELDTKLLISDIKRIPCKDEYIDDIKYCISGIVENYAMISPKQIISGLNMATPVETPKPSKHNIPSMALHHHWSPTKIPPGPLPKQNQAVIDEMKRRQEVLRQAFEKIYGTKSTKDETSPYHNCKTTCKSPIIVTKNKKAVKRLTTDEDGKIQDIDIVEDKIIKKLQNKTTLHKVEKEREIENIPHIERDMKRLRALDDSSKITKDVHAKHEIKEHSQQDSAPKSRTVQETNEYVKTQMKSIHNETDLMTTIKTELQKMAEEGFLFAKLPKCFLMPQLQDWLMYRKGISFSDVQKEQLMQTSIVMWNSLNTLKSPEIKVPSLGISKHVLKHLTYDKAYKIKHKIQMKKATFYSNIRKARVMYARTMWATMEYGQFLLKSFKRSYFTYMASKESDGYVFKPWMPSEMRMIN